MSTPTLNVRIKHKYDTYAAWMASTIVLEVGEIAIAEIPNTEAESGLTPPTIGIKVGDGTKTFSQLNWIQSIAGDVHSWAKETKKPVYTADEIDGLEEYIEETSNDSNTTYQFVRDDENERIIVYSKELTQEEYPSDVANAYFVFDLPFSSKVDKITTAVEGNIPSFTAGGGLSDSGTKISDYLTIADASSTYATRAEHDTLSETVSNIDTEFRGRIEANESDIDDLQTAVNVLNGESDGSVKKQVADAVAGILNGAPENYDTLKEIADFITTDITGAAGLVNRVSEVEDDINALLEASHTHDNKLILDTITEERVNAWDAAGGNAEAYVDEKIAAEAAQREVLAGRVSTLEGVVGDASGGLVKNVADVVTTVEEMSENVSRIDGVASSAVQTVTIAGFEDSETAVTKSGTNVTINQIPVSALVNNNMTLIFNCGNATEVI